FLLVLALAVTQLLPQTPKLYTASETWKWVVLIIADLVFAGGYYLAYRAQTPSRKLILCLLSPVLLMSIGSFLVPTFLRMRKMPGPFLGRNAARLEAADICFADEILSPTLCWFTGRSDVYLLGDMGELEYGLSYSDSEHRVVKNEEFEGFLKAHPGKRVLFLTRTLDYYRDYEHVLPAPTHLETADGFLLLEYESEPASQ
ncbi:MAG: hypothetical protein GY809_33035, partial [Planctomycetes bacterium]|nr:hypothetical protein [Planctomycetota bacterium]